MKSQSHPLYRQVNQITLSSDEGLFSLFSRNTSILSFLQHDSPLSITPQVYQDERCQQAVNLVISLHSQIRSLFTWYLRHVPTPSFTVLTAHCWYEYLLSTSGSGHTQQRELALQLAKSYLQLPANRNDLRFYLNYIDLCLLCGKHEEAQRVARGSLRLLPRLDTSAQRYHASILRRIVNSLLEENGSLTEVRVRDSQESVSLWREITVKEVSQFLEEELLPQNSQQTMSQVERKLVYLLKRESDYVKQVGYLGIPVFLSLL